MQIFHRYFSINHPLFHALQQYPRRRDPVQVVRGCFGWRSGPGGPGLRFFLLYAAYTLLWLVIRSRRRDPVQVVRGCRVWCLFLLYRKIQAGRLVFGFC